MASKMEFKQELLNIIKNGSLLLDEPMSRHTTFGTGGPASFFVKEQGRDAGKEAASVIALCQKEKMPYYILGNGSNVLFADEGYDGLVIYMAPDNAEDIIIEEKEASFKVSVNAGAMLGATATKVSRLGGRGFEFAAGIPGSVGGAVFMNAGAYDGQINDVIINAEVYLIENGEVTRRVYSKEDLKLSYRHSALMEHEENGSAVICAAAEFEVKKGNAKEAMDLIAELREKRVSKQPLEYKSAGSTFKRPENNYAGKLIQEAGLRGYSVGDAQVSEKHCGFVINKGAATTGDIVTLMRTVIDRVYENSGIRLEPEVRLVGVSL